LAGLLIATLRQLRARQRRLAELEAAGARRRRRAQPEPATAPTTPGNAREARP
jgi:hypothetical protein